LKEKSKKRAEVLGEWFVLKLRDGDPIPAVKGCEISIKSWERILKVKF